MRTSYRIGIAVLGIVVVLIGLFAWSIENEYGSGLNFTLEGEPGGTTVVYEDQTGRTPVFEGTQEEAFAYMDRRRSAGESFVIPAVIITVGAAIVLLAFVPWRRLRSGARDDASTSS